MDDEDVILKLEARWLTEAGHAVDMARNNKEALALYDGGLYDVVLTDAEHLEEHGPDGGEGLKLVIAVLARNPEQKVGFITGQEIPTYPRLPKPFTPNELIQFVDQLSGSERDRGN